MGDEHWIQRPVAQFALSEGYRQRQVKIRMWSAFLLTGDQPYTDAGGEARC